MAPSVHAPRCTEVKSRFDQRDRSLLRSSNLRDRSRRLHSSLRHNAGAGPAHRHPSRHVEVPPHEKHAPDRASGQKNRHGLRWSEARHRGAPRARTALHPQSPTGLHLADQSRRSGTGDAEGHRPRCRRTHSQGVRKQRCRIAPPRRDHAHQWTDARSSGPDDRERRRSSGSQRIDWPVLPQSARNAARPLSVSGWALSPLSTAGGTVATSAPARADSLTWFGVRIEAARISVEKP